MDQLPLVSIITPAYNEEAILVNGLKKVYSYMEALKSLYDFELLVINDGSKDNTGELADSFARKNSKTRVIHHMVNLNLGNALKTGFLHAKGSYIIVLDIDMSYDVDHIEKLLNTIVTTQADIVLASPYMPGGKVTAVPFLRKFLSKGANRFLRFAAQEKFYTYTSIVRAYRADFIKSLNLKTTDYEISTEILYKAMVLRARVIEIPAHLDWTEQNQHKGSRASGIRLFRNFLSSLMSGFIYRPYIFFLGVGTILLLISLYIIIWIFINTFIILPDIPLVSDIDTSRFARAVLQIFRERPYSFFVGGVIFISAIQFLSLGFIALQNKRYFDELFHINTSILKNQLPAKNS